MKNVPDAEGFYWATYRGQRMVVYVRHKHFSQSHDLHAFVPGYTSAFLLSQLSEWSEQVVDGVSEERKADA